MRISELYGVEPSQPSPLGAMIDVRPSRGLLDKIGSLNRGSRIGLESFDPRVLPSELKIGGKKLTLSGMYYWNELREVCLASQLEVVHLGDPKLTREISMDTVGLARINSKLERFFDAHPDQQKQTGVKVSDELRDLNESWYRTKAKRDFLSHVKQGQGLRDRLLKEDLSVVVVYKGQANQLVLNPGSGDRRIDVDSYMMEEMDMQDAVQDAGRMLVGLPGKPHFESVLVPGEVDGSINSIEESARRGFNAATKLRVLPGETPNIIGTWKTQCRPEGLFELYVDGSHPEFPFSGIIEDVNGTAYFYGEMTDASVQLTKTYSLGKARPGAFVTDAIFYEGKRVGDGLYKGLFEVPGRYKDLFTLNMGSTLQS